MVGCWVEGDGVAVLVCPCEGVVEVSIAALDGLAAVLAGTHTVSHAFTIPYSDVFVRRCKFWEMRKGAARRRPPPLCGCVRSVGAAVLNSRDDVACSM